MTKGIIHENCDYVTVVTMDVPTGKLYEVINGQVVKTPAANNANGWAVTHYVPDVDAMAKLIVEISTNIKQALILGFIRGTEGEVGKDRGTPYRLMSDKDFREFAKANSVKLDKFASKPIEVDGRKYATRTKRMFHNSTWLGFDRDVVDGMPDQLEPTAKFPRWWEMMNEMMPEVRGCNYVAVKSASCRVSYKGKPLADTNIHVYMQAKIAKDTERFGKAGMVHSFMRGYGFMRPVKDRLTGEIIGQRPWTLYDPTTFSRERLFFDGSPILNPEDPAVALGELTIEPSKPIVFKGANSRVNTKALALPSQEEQIKWGLEIAVDKQGRVTIINPRDLTPDIQFEYKDPATGENGVMTMRDFVNGDVDRLRCQSVFRPDSSSFAAYVSKEDGCHPFMYDVGTNINYKYSDSVDAFTAAGIGHDVGAMEVREVPISPEMVHTFENSDANERVYIDPTTTREAPFTIDNDSREVIKNAGWLDDGTVHDYIPKPPANDFAAPDLSHLSILPNDVNSPEHGEEEFDKIIQSKQGSNGQSVIYGELYGSDVSDEYAETDLANAERFAFMYDNELKFVPVFKSWFQWKGHRWEQCVSQEQRSAAHHMVLHMGRQSSQLPDDHSFRKWARVSLNSPAIGSLLKEASAMQKMVVGQDDIDSNWFNFGVGNGYVDLRLGGENDGNVGLNRSNGVDGSDRPSDVSVSDVSNGSGSLDGTAGRNGDGGILGHGRNDSGIAQLIGFKESDRNLFITKCSDVDFVAGAGCPVWENTLRETFSHDAELVSFFQKFVGYTMLGNPVHEVLAFFVGNGSNGKSTITGIMDRIFGDYKATVDKAVLMTKRDTSGGQGATPALARLKGIRLAVITETREGDQIDEAVVKALSGGDKITARHLHGNTMEFEPSHVSWIATNHPPQIRSVDDGTWRRIWYFHFKRNFLAEQGRKKLDTGLKQRIIDTELSGVLNWCLEGVRRYHIEGIEPPASILDATAQYKDDMDIIADWLNVCVEYGAEFEVSYTQLWQSYQNYSLGRGDHLIKQSRTLNAKISAKGFEKVTHVKGHNNERGFKGLRIRQLIPQEV